MTVEEIIQFYREGRNEKDPLDDLGLLILKMVKEVFVVNYIIGGVEIKDPEYFFPNLKKSWIVKMSTPILVVLSPTIKKYRVKVSIEDLASERPRKKL